ncbi:MAG: hypothetical protein IH869_06920 [Chloroflexi bacterium]|nr:hypothetical protein [Chloroflexota bacterium]
MRLPRVFDRQRRRYEELVTRHLDGVLDAAGETRLQDLLDADPALAAEARELEAVTAVLRAEPLVEPPRSFALPYAPARVLAAPRPGPLRWMQAATATAALVLVTLIGVDLVVAPATVSEAPELSAATAEQAPVASQAAPPPPDALELDAATSDGIEQDEVQPFPLTRSLAPEPEPAPAAGRSALDWAQLGFALATALLALGVALVSWRAARSRA